MTTSRRHFFKTAGTAGGAISLPALPSWIKALLSALKVKEFQFSSQSEAV
jgi:hypothetical protein